MEGIHGVTSVLVAASVRYWWVVVVSLKSVIVYLTGEEFCLVGWLVGWLVVLHGLMTHFFLFSSESV